MMLEPQSSQKRFLISLAIALLLVGILVYIIQFPATAPTAETPEGQMCTMEAKLCSDGSYVGRTGPNCEFAPCPEVMGVPGTENWRTSTDQKSGLSFKYPEQLGTTYISTVDWPPQLQVESKAFTCTEAGTETDRAGKTEKRLVDSRTYCVTTESEGAAGSIYNQYAYVFAHDNQTAIVTFTLRFPQCANYDDPQRTACEQERTTFDLDSVVDKIAQTLHK